MWKECGQRLRRRNVRRRGGRYGWDGDRDVLNWWGGESNVSHIALGMEPNAPHAFASGLEHHHPIMSMLGDPGGLLER